MSTIMDAVENRPIFVVGCPRSGTTLLQLMLHAHPRIAIPPETRFVLEAYTRRHEFGDLENREARRALAHWIVRRRSSRFRDLGLERRAVSSQIRRGPRTLGSALGIVFRAYAHRFGKVRWGDKRPAYVHYIDELLRMFPNAQIVHLVRDGRDCVGSLKHMSWYRHDSVYAMATWAQAMDDADSARRRWGSDTVYELRYEDLVSDPKTELVGLCSFLGEEFDPAMLEPNAVAQVAVPQRKVWHRNTHREVSTDRAGTWRERLDPAETRLCSWVLASRLRARGYAAQRMGWPGLRLLLRYGWTVTRRRAATRRRRWMDAWRRWWVPRPPLVSRLD
ncbi:sulfotransferase [Lipingzhangella sp. LS1_29]|uniref:Sulfotransferase n=1 Tax=Lipingzhangella rawalii TaxID=2055835 RepID=A0ABU2H1H1_9ACTN|nr:sulfotransferase [Lipingzhangella rawalii]MDS1269141.1 sulfotransferase [Lipingzhangella rawalii]